MAKRDWQKLGKALGLPEDAGSPGKEVVVNNDDRNIWREAVADGPNPGAATDRLQQVREMVLRQNRPANVLDQPIEGIVPTFRVWVHGNEKTVETDWGPRFGLTGGNIGPTQRSESPEKPEIFGHFSVGYIEDCRWSSKRAGYYWHLVMDDQAAEYIWKVIKANQSKAIQVLVYAPTWSYDTVEDDGERVIKTYPNKNGTLVAAGRLHKVTTQYCVVVAEAGSNDPNFYLGENVVSASDELDNTVTGRMSLADQIRRAKETRQIEQIARDAGLKMPTRRTPSKASDYQPNSER